MTIVPPEILISRNETWARNVMDAHRRLQGVVRRTPVEDISDIVPESGAKVFAKLENLQRTGSFKLRGATNRILQLSPEEKARGVVAASVGNHGLGVAAAAERAGVPAEIYLPPQVAAEKIARMRQFGARVVQVGPDSLDAEIAARREALESGRVFISPYNDWDVVAGQGTIAVELLEQLPHLDAVFVAVGGGGLIGGIGAYSKHASPHTEVVGCWPENSPVMYEAIKAGRIVPVEERQTLSESTMGGIEEGSITFEIARSVMDSHVLVGEEEILAAMRLVHRTRQWLVEGAAGVALAAFLKTAAQYEGKTVAIVICGGNLSAHVRELI